MNGARLTFSRLLADTAANVLALSAVGVLVSAAMVGGGIDMGRAWRVENRLQSACDSAVLAGRRAVSSNGFDEAARGQAQVYFNTNFDQNRLEAENTAFSAESAESGNIITGTASTTIDTVVMQLFGFNEFNLSVSCTASMGVGNSDVVMVLDTTGSMDEGLNGSTRIAALRSAMKNFYDTVKTATQGSNSRIRYGFVPYSQSVNVGGLLMAEDPSYIVDTWQIQSREPQWEWDQSTDTNTESGPSTEEVQLPGQYNSKNSCENNLPSNGSWEVVSSSTADPVFTQTEVPQSKSTVTTQEQRRLLYVCRKSGSKWYRNWYYQTRTVTSTVLEHQEFDYWEYKQITYDVSQYKLGQQVTTRNGDYGAPQTSSTWNGCIEERDTVNAATYSYSSIDGMSPADAFDLDIDMAPDPADDNTRWRPMWSEVAYYRSGDSSSVTTSGSKASSACPRAARLMAEMDESEFDAYADSLFPQGNTYLDLGLLWGARLSSPDGIFKDNVDIDPENGGEVSRHLIFMTDGDMDPDPRIYSSYGVEINDRRVTYDGLSRDQTDTVAKARHLSRFRAICSAIKDKGIRVWVIAFTGTLTTDLKNCASANSSFTASSSEQLNAAFQEIAKQVGELRITQ